MTWKDFPGDSRYYLRPLEKGFDGIHAGNVLWGMAKCPNLRIKVMVMSKVN